jgi:hypothetical protein
MLAAVAARKVGSISSFLLFFYNVTATAIVLAAGAARKVSMPFLSFPFLSFPFLPYNFLTLTLYYFPFLPVNNTTTGMCVFAATIVQRTSRTPGGLKPCPMGDECDKNESCMAYKGQPLCYPGLFTAIGGGGGMLNKLFTCPNNNKSSCLPAAGGTCQSQSRQCVFNVRKPGRFNRVCFLFFFTTVRFSTYAIQVPIARFCQS